MKIKEYRTPMPFTVEEYRIGQLYMIAKHSHEESRSGEGVEALINEHFEDAVRGSGQHTVKRIYLSSKLPVWIQSLLPRIFYMTEEAWNFFPYTKTEYSCSVVPLLSISIESVFEDNAGTSQNPGLCYLILFDKRAVMCFKYLPPVGQDQVRPQPLTAEQFWDQIRQDKCKCDPSSIRQAKFRFAMFQALNLSEADQSEREIDFVDIALESIAAEGNSENSNCTRPDLNLKNFKSTMSDRGPFLPGWQDICRPIMCSYKVVKVKFEVWGFQTKVENFVHQYIRNILLKSHQQAVIWMDEWLGLSLEDVRAYETDMQEKTNHIVKSGLQ